jgi:Mg2+ and Co2+ transporter CorA
LKRIIWAGLALRILDDRLSASLSQINNARVALDNNITQDEGQMHAELLQEYINIMESFDKRFSNLSNAQARIELRIKHITGLRDGVSILTFMFKNTCLSFVNMDQANILKISTVTNVQDSRTTIRQGKNIGALTLLTIAYLPLTFITVLSLSPKKTFVSH